MYGWSLNGLLERGHELLVTAFRVLHAVAWVALGVFASVGWRAGNISTAVACFAAGAALMIGWGALSWWMSGWPTVQRRVESAAVRLRVVHGLGWFAAVGLAWAGWSSGEVAGPFIVFLPLGAGLVLGMFLGLAAVGPGSPYEHLLCWALHEDSR